MVLPPPPCYSGILYPLNSHPGIHHAISSLMCLHQASTRPPHHSLPHSDSVLHPLQPWGDYYHIPPSPPSFSLAIFLSCVFFPVFPSEFQVKGSTESPSRNSTIRKHGTTKLHYTRTTLKPVTTHGRDGSSWIWSANHWVTRLCVHHVNGFLINHGIKIYPRPSKLSWRA